MTLDPEPRPGVWKPLAAPIRWAVERSGVVLTLAALLLGYSLYRVSHASLDIFPEFAGKRIVIQTEAPGFTTEQVETLVTLPIERKLLGLIGLAQLRSESIQGLSVVTAVFAEDTDLHRDRQWVSERLSLLTGQLPEGVGAPVLLPLASSSATILTLGITSERLNLMDLRSYADWILVPRLLAVAGVADVNVFGGEVRQLQVRVVPERLRRFGLDLNAVAATARQAMAVRGLGFVENENQRLPLQLAGLPVTPASLREVLLERTAQGSLRLGDVATVGYGPKPPIGAAAIGGEPGVVLMVIGQYGAKTLSVSRRVEAALRELAPLAVREGITVYPRLFRPADYIERSLGNLASHLFLGGLLVIAVLYAFLGNVRTALISALAIPLSLLGAAVTLLANGVSLDLMVLGGLAIALGEVVDDAIIDTENIFRRLRENRQSSAPRPTAEVVYHASLEIRGSVTYASFIVALVFVPLLVLHGVAGRLFAPLGHAYILAILISLATALTVTPALSSMLLGHSRRSLREPPLVRRLQPRYERLLRAVTAHPARALALGLAVCTAAIALAPRLGGDFLPSLREGHFIVHTTSLPGTSLAESMRIGTAIVRKIREIPGVESVSQWAGRAERGADTYGSHYSEYEVRLQPLSGSGQQTVLERIRALLTDFPGIRFEVNTFLTERINETLSGYTAPLVVQLYGSDLDALDRKGRQIAALIRAVPGATDVQLRSPPGAPLAEIRLRLDRLATWGLQPADVIQAVETAGNGWVFSRFAENGRLYEAAVIADPDSRRSFDQLRNLPLRARDGIFVPLEQVAELAETGGRYNILHQGGRRVQTVTASVQGRDLQSFFDEVRRRIHAEVEFSQDIYPEFTGAAVEQSVAREELLVQSLLAGSGVLLLIHLAIGNLRHTLITLANLPFSLAGGVLAASLPGVTLSVGTMVGFVTLFGITVRNSIMLLSHYRHLVEREGRPWNLETAIRGAQERLPSILMTALVTALAMLPIAIGSDNPGREIMGPMATIIIGGLFSSTALNLLLLPAVLARWGLFRAKSRAAT
jgi:CzcA family heavy metal efflux pump